MYVWPRQGGKPRAPTSSGTIRSAACCDTSRRPRLQQPDSRNVSYDVAAVALALRR